MIKMLVHERSLKFVIVGCSNALIGYLIFSSLFHSQLFEETMRTASSQAISYLVGVIWSFLWNRHWAFKTTRHGGRSWIWDSLRFLTVQISCLLLSIVLVTTFIDGMGWKVLPGWVLAMTIVTTINYLATAHWVFPAGRIGSPAASDGEAE